MANNQRSSLHSNSQVISQHLSSVSALLTTNAPLLSSLSVYPLPSYPGREQENVLHQLLRKKLEPQVEDWVEEGRVAGARLDVQGGKEDIEELWEWAGMAANEQARKHEWGGEYTLEEIEQGTENVVTGLNRRMGEESEDEEEEEEEEDVIEVDKGGEKRVQQGKDKKQVPQPLTVDDFLRFMAKGVEPVEENPEEDSK